MPDWQEARDNLLNNLRRIKAEGPRVPANGICSNAKPWVHSHIEINLLYDVFRVWPKRSGVCGYPVPSGDTYVGAVTAYNAATDCWDRNTEYGRLRWELLDFCIEQVEAMTEPAGPKED